MRPFISLCFALLACSEPQLQQKKSPNGKSPSAINPNAEDQSQQGLPRAKVALTTEGGQELTVRVEVAYDDDTRRQGLMFRQKLADDAGMLFLFNKEEHQSFWMKNTYLPLDMIFIKSDMTVLGVYEGAVPLTEDGRAVDGNSQYVLEVNAGYARRHGIKAGSKVRFVGTENIPVK